VYFGFLFSHPTAIPFGEVSVPPILCQTGTTLTHFPGQGQFILSLITTKISMQARNSPYTLTRAISMLAFAGDAKFQGPFRSLYINTIY